MFSDRLVRPPAPDWDHTAALSLSEGIYKLFEHVLIHHSIGADPLCAPAERVGLWKHSGTTVSLFRDVHWCCWWRRDQPQWLRCGRLSFPCVCGLCIPTAAHRYLKSSL